VGPRARLDTEARGKILSPLPAIEPLSPGRPAYSPDTILTELPLLTYIIINILEIKDNRFDRCFSFYIASF
jgi:hypothetical protein